MRFLSHRLWLVAAIYVLWVGPLFAADPVQQRDQAGSSSHSELYQHAVVAADHPLASEAGIEILKQGGNVVDAAVATGFALSVLRPASSGIGGGGFMVIWNAETHQSVAIDYREQAPLKATRNMYIDANDPNKSNVELSRRGHLAVAVPGHVAGLCYANKKYGKLSLKTVLAPAIRLAREGTPIEDHILEGPSIDNDPFWKNRGHLRKYATLYERYLNGGKRWKKDDRFYSPQRKVLERIAEKGADGFYRGPVADAIVEEMQRGNGLITHKDLQLIQPIVRRPIEGKFRGLQIITMPPPSSGGIALVEILNILTAYEKIHPGNRLEKLKHNSPKYLHLLTEAMKHAFADRAEFLGDADFADVPTKRLISSGYATKLASRIDMSKTKPLKEYGRFLPVDDSGTTHFSIIDRDGNAVACTETINTGFGSYVVEPKYGIVLNNEMDDFAALPGRPNVFGLIQSEANAVEPRKKPLSSMTPTIIIKNGKAIFALGASGGPRIISTTLQVFLNLAQFEMSPTTAIEQPRIHHQWFPNSIYVEDPLYEARQESLSQFGHQVNRRNRLAACQAAKRSSRGLQAASDPRKHGRHAGY